MRDVRGPRCGVLRLVGSIDRYAAASPRTLLVLRNPQLEAYFEARLRGEHPPMPEWTRWAQPAKVPSQALVVCSVNEHPFDDML